MEMCRLYDYGDRIHAERYQRKYTENICTKIFVQIATTSKMHPASPAAPLWKPLLASLPQSSPLSCCLPLCLPLLLPDPPPASCSVLPSATLPSPLAAPLSVLHSAPLAALCLCLTLVFSSPHPLLACFSAYPNPPPASTLYLSLLILSSRA